MEKILFHADEFGNIWYFCPRFPSWLCCIFGKILPRGMAQRWMSIMRICNKYNRKPNYFESVMWNIADYSRWV